MPTVIARWRGFNLIDLFSTSIRSRDFFPLADRGIDPDEDFALIRDLGFDFVRLPISYPFLGTSPHGLQPDPERLWLTDRVLEPGRTYDIHIALAFHRAPGFCVLSGSPYDVAERGDLFADDDKLDEFGIGYAMWNFRGHFGIMDSGRTDAVYEQYRRHLMDRRLTDVLTRARPTKGVSP